MEEKYSYNSCLTHGSSEIREKGSRFIGLAYPLSRFEDVDELLALAKKQYPGANHYCFAYKWGMKEEMYRANDDGEPAHSAGSPILGQISSFDLTDTLVIVVRYFGGTKLGVGGLIKAYKEAAKLALNQAGVKVITLKKQYELLCDYSLLSEVLDICKKHKLPIVSTQMKDICTLTLEFALPEERDWQNYFWEYPTLQIKLIK